MITLGLETCEARGSVALWRDGVLASLQEHETAEDYSSWLLPAVEKCLAKAGTTLSGVDVFAVATGPGSFTALRVGLTTVKAWAELYQKPVVGVSRLEVMARTLPNKGRGYVAASFDARRGQIFGGLFHIETDGRWTSIEPEVVIGADEFVGGVAERVGKEALRWISLDPQLIEAAPNWKSRAQRGETIVLCKGGLAAGVAALGEARAGKGEVSDALHLDANYVRRSDAEMFWVDGAKLSGGKRMQRRMRAA